MNSIEDAKYQESPPTRKTDETVTMSVELAKETEETMKLHISWEFHLGHFKAFLKIVLTCIKLQTNSWLTLAHSGLAVH